MVSGPLNSSHIPYSLINMSCQGCSKRGGSSRCEGCQRLFCISCTQKHYDERIQHFQTISDLRNQMKEKLNVLHSKKDIDSAAHPVILAIDEWEKQMITNIRNVAKDLTEKVNGLMKENFQKMDDELEKISTTIQKEEKKETYLEPDINGINQQLLDLQKQMDAWKDNIQLDTRKSNEIQWYSLITITMKNVSKKSLIQSTPTNTASVDITNEGSSQNLTQPGTLRKRCPLTIMPTSHPNPPSSSEHFPINRTDCPRKPLLHPSLADFQRRTDQSRLCRLCEHYSDDVSSIGLCATCDHALEHSKPIEVAEHTASIQTGSARTSSSTHRQSDSNKSKTSTTSPKNTKQVFCKCCGYINTRPYTSQSSYKCEMCLMDL